MRVLIQGFLDKSETSRLLELDRSQLRTITDVLTGHWLVNYHLHTIGLSDGPECKFCGEVDEVFQCDVLSNSRIYLLGDYYLEPEDIRRLKPEKVLCFLDRTGLSGYGRYVSLD